MQPATNTCVKDHQFFPYCLLKTVPCILKKIKGTVSLLRWGNTSCFFPILRPVLEAPTVLFLISSDEEPKEGDPISKYCSRPKVLGTFGCDLQVLWPIPPFIQGRGCRSFSFFLLILWRKAGHLLHIVFRNLVLKASSKQETAITGLFPWALLQRKSCSSRTFPDEMLS